MGMFFTSDLHINHDKEFLYKPRGFKNITEMNDAIIKNFNEVLTWEDSLYILGDIVMGGEISKSEWNRVLRSIPCKNIYYITGNHDTITKQAYYQYELCFNPLGYAYVMKYNKHISFYLSHYPTFTDNFDNDKKGHRVINLFGHTHSKDKFYNGNRYMYNVALDAHNCYPVEINQILSDIKEDKNK